ncbi:MAG: hypothetical protein ACI89X_002858 [Planctomycetota bacterium]|jgi:hypothetical protein
MDRAFTTLLLLLLAGLGSTVLAQEGFPVTLDQGPLICFSKATNDKPHRVNLYVANCDGDQKGKRFWQNAGNSNVVARLDQTHLLVASYTEPYGLIVVDTKTGKHRMLAEGSSHDFVAVHGDEVLYLGDNRWDTNDNHLFARSWRIEAERRKLAEPLFDSVPIVRGNLAIGITDGSKEVWSVSLTRSKGRKLYELPEGARQVQLSLAPGAQRLAIGANKVGRGHLAVVDIGSAKRLNSWDNLTIDVSPLSSSTPTVRVGWFDDEHVVTSETRGGRGRAFGGGNFTFIRRSIETGKITDDASYGPVKLHHHRPPAPDAEKAPTPVFEIQTKGDEYLLIQKGKKDPVQAVPKDYRTGAKIRLAQDSAFAIVKLAHNPQLVQLYRPGKSPLALSSVGGMDWRWLPAKGVVESSK